MVKSAALRLSPLVYHWTITPFTPSVRVKLRRQCLTTNLWFTIWVSYTWKGMNKAVPSINESRVQSLYMPLPLRQDDPWKHLWLVDGGYLEKAAPVCRHYRWTAISNNESAPMTSSLLRMTGQKVEPWLFSSWESIKHHAAKDNCKGKRKKGLTLPRFSSSDEEGIDITAAIDAKLASITYQGM